MNALPTGWVLKPIGELILPFRSVDPTKQPTKQFTYIDIGAIDNITQTISNPRNLLGKEAPSRARRLVREGDMDLLRKSGEFFVMKEDLYDQAEAANEGI